MLLNIYRNKIIDGYFLFCYLLLKVGWRVSVSWIQNKKIQILNNYINSALFKSYMKKIKKKKLNSIAIFIPPQYLDFLLVYLFKVFGSCLDTLQTPINLPTINLWCTFTCELNIQCPNKKVTKIMIIFETLLEIIIKKNKFSNQFSNTFELKFYLKTQMEIFLPWIQVQSKTTFNVAIIKSWTSESSYKRQFHFI